MKHKLSNIEQALSSKYDVFIASSSYEKRSTTIITHLTGENRFSYQYVVINTPISDNSEENFATYKDKNFIPIEIDRRDQLVTAKKFVNEIISVLHKNPDATFLIDISTFRRQSLLILLRLLRNLLAMSNKVDFVYTPAKEYAIGLSEAEKWLSKGVVEVTSVFGFSGRIRPSRPYHLIILMGYEVERATSLIAAYEPYKISIGYARKSHSIADEHYELNKKRFDELLAEFPYAESFEFTCVDVESCTNDILKQVEKYSDYNIVVSPMNNKISTIACGIAAFENEEIQLSIATPATYNTENYSLPGDTFFKFGIKNFIKTPE